MNNAIKSKVKPVTVNPRILFLTKYARNGASSRYHQIYNDLTK